MRSKPVWTVLLLLAALVLLFVSKQHLLMPKAESVRDSAALMVCDSLGTRYPSPADARAAGLVDGEFGVTYCPEHAAALHSSWDKNQDGLNDCEDEGICDHMVDYTKPRR